MSAKPRDHRPKVISFRTALDGLNIAARQSVLWPCHAFNISIPQKKKSGLNVFEETVLKITEIESGDTEKIALLTCLEKELVAFIQNRLRQLCLLNDRNELREEGQKLLESWRNKDEASIEYVAGTVFLDLHSGKLLPYIHIGNLKQEKISSIDGLFVTVELGSTGRSQSVRCRQILPGADARWKKVPDSNDIIRAIREFKKRYKRYALLSQGVDQYPPPVPMAEAISLHENPELVYLHCNVLIQTGNSELLVTDGVGFGFSENFANYITSKDFPWVINLKQQGVVDNFGNAEGWDNQPARKSFKYAEISRCIVRSKSALGKIKNLEVNSTYYESNYRQEIENGIKNLYAALEWSLRQVVAENPVSEWEQIFSVSNYRDNEKLLAGFASKVGFVVNDKNQSLLQVKSGAIQQIDRGKVELQPLLALAIAGAYGNATHPIYRLAQNHSGFLTHALRLKKYRDPIEHGSTEKLNIDDKKLEELIESTVPTIISLVPGVAYDLGEVDKVVSDGDINQERLKACIELEKALGTAFVSILSGDIKEQLIRSELMLAQFSVEKTIEIIKCYASVMQHALFDAVKDRRLEVKSDTIRESAVEKIVQSGFYSAPDAIPEQISTVNTKRLYRAVQGSSTTLGAHLLAVFLLGSESELIELQKSDAKFVDFVANLIRLRGHGNKQQSDFSRDDMESLKNNVFKAIKIITEVF
ncbi:TPA: hypothetical protein SLZ46_000737 [Vibrio cholerae]|uniref:hypothetical protein n=1 Tax=Vibrio cholerae TaxID=666 RepID=UPI001562AA74|nr:hypothetical protein [Vibrio cholerae]MCD9212418.1 hypothetical protein [Vibrio cholerae]MDV2322634.1 hypothetical protein [Vibrio cholerae]HEJ2449058.1 hypothetical protein [Vibrio cholerae]HEJ2463788.1 hypothetical protein [Vibrio cholerae]